MRSRFKKTRKRGFTIAECLISIAVLAICLSGVLAALAFDAFSSEQTGFLTFATGYNRRILDLMQSGQLDPTTISVTGAPAPTDGTVVGGLRRPPPIDGTIWRALDQGLLGTGGGAANFWGAPGSAELQRFDIEKGRYRVNIVANRLIPNFTGAAVETRYRNQLSEIVITTLWQARQGIRTARLRGYYATSPNP